MNGQNNNIESEIKKSVNRESSNTVMQNKQFFLIPLDGTQKNSAYKNQQTLQQSQKFQIQYQQQQIIQPLQQSSKGFQLSASDQLQNQLPSQFTKTDLQLNKQQNLFEMLQNHKSKDQFYEQKMNKMNLGCELKQESQKPTIDIKYYQILLQILPEGIAILGNTFNNILFINKSMESYFGCTDMQAIEKLLSLQNGLDNLGHNTQQTMGNSMDMPALLKMKNIINKSNTTNAVKKSTFDNQPKLDVSALGSKSPNRSYFSMKYNIMESIIGPSMCKIRSVDLLQQQLDQHVEQDHQDGGNLLKSKLVNNLAQQGEVSINEVYLSQNKDLGSLYQQIITNLENHIRVNKTQKYETFFNQYQIICPYERNNKQNSQSKFDYSEIKQRLRTLEVNCFPCIIENQPSVLFVMRDVTHFNQLKLLKSINKNKSQMLSQVAHEFRTPLTCIIGMLNFALESNSVDQLNQQYLFSALTSAEQLQYMVNDLLDLAQLKAGQFSLKLTEFNLYNLIYSLLNMLNLLAQQKSIELVCKYELDEQLLITSDSNRLRQIIINLVSNALKFTSKNGKVTIQCKQGDKQNTIYISVKDTGIGINKEQRNSLFKAFGKITGDEQNKLNPNGIGLGLVISNMLASNLGEKEGLQIESEENQGCNFYFLLKNQNENDLTVSQQQHFYQQSEQFNAKKEHNYIISPKLHQVFKDNCEEEKVKYQIHNSSVLKNRQERQSKDYGINESYHNQVRNNSFDISNKNKCTNLKQGKNKSPQPKVKLFKCKQISLDQTKDSQANNLRVSFFIEGNSPFQNPIHNVCAEIIKILIVDDQPNNCFILKKFLHWIDIKFEVQEAFSGEEAIEIIEQNWNQFRVCFNVVFLDISMPVMDGFEVFQMIKKFSEGKYKQIVIACSGYSESLEKNKCLQIGMNHYIEKPINKQGLKMLMQQLGFV